MSRHIHKLSGRKPDNHNWFPTPQDIVDRMIANYGYALKGKSIHCFADDYQTSKFYLTLKTKFNELGLTKLYATKYVENGKGIQAYYDGANEIVKELDDDGSCLNECSRATTNDCDVIFTNPPFKNLKKIFREVVNGKQFVLIMPYVCLPLEVLVGLADHSMFVEPETIAIWNYDHTKVARCDIVSSMKSANYKDLPLKKLTCLYDPKKYLSFKNMYEPHDILPNIVNCDKVKNIPKDYAGIIAVPECFVIYAANCPQQFDIVGSYNKNSKGNTLLNDGKYLHISKNTYRLTDGRMPFLRVLVKVKGNVQ